MSFEYVLALTDMEVSVHVKFLYCRVQIGVTRRATYMQICLQHLTALNVNEADTDEQQTHIFIIK